MSTLKRNMLAIIAGAALLVLGIAGSASAQDYTPRLPQAGIITNVPNNLSGTQAGLLDGEGALNLSDNAKAFQVPLVAAPAGTGGGGGAQLAFTGAQSNVLAISGMTLMLVGGGAVIAARKRS